MPRRLLRRFLPDHHKIRDHKHLRLFGTLLHDPNLWHLNRRSVAGAFAVGLFCAWVPIPFQMVLAAAMAIALRVNLPISAALVWLTNPITMPPLFYLAYKLGAWLLGRPALPFHFELSWAWLVDEVGVIGAPFLFGCLVLGIFHAAAGYLAVRGLWRLHLVRSWQARKRRRNSHRG